MENLKEFYAEIKNYSKLGIKSFINIHTENLKPSLVIDFNSEFVDLYLSEINAESRKGMSVEFKDSVAGNIFDIEGCNSAYPAGTDHILVRRYEILHGIIDVNETVFKGENLSYRDYNRLNFKISDFQDCMQDIVKEINENTSNKILTSPDLESLDLSDTTAVEKIIYLEKLGVLDFLRNKQHISTNGLASALSAITGENIKTLQPMLNPIFNKQAGQKNNPLESTKTVQKVKKHLNDIGFNLSETI